MSNCPICNKPTKTGLKTCSNKDCIRELKKRTCIERYGETAPAKNPAIVEKSRQTCLKKYGVDNIFRKKDYIRSCTKEKLGVENIFQNKEYIRKCVERKYGVSNPNYIKVGKEIEEILLNKDKFISFFKDHQNESTSTIYLGKLLGVTSKCIIDKFKEFGLEQYLNYMDSGYEAILKGYIEELGYKVERSNRSLIKPLEIDLYIPEKNIGIEFNGNYWHDSNHKDKYYHQRKLNKCIEKGITLINIFGHEWKEKEDFYKKYLKYLLDGRPELGYTEGSIGDIGTYKLKEDILYLSFPVSNLPDTLNYSQVVYSANLGNFNYQGYERILSEPNIIKNIYDCGNFIFRRI